MPYTYNTLGTVAPGDVLRANSGTAAYNSVITNVNGYRVPPLCVTTGVNTSQTLTNGVYTNLQFTGADLHDTDSIHNPSSNSDQFVTATAGIYAVSGYLQINNTNVTAGLLGISVNGTIRFESGTGSPISASAMRLSISGLCVCAANDIVRLAVYQESSPSASRNPSLGNMSLVWVGQVS